MFITFFPITKISNFKIIVGMTVQNWHSVEFLLSTLVINCSTECESCTVISTIILKLLIFLTRERLYGYLAYIVNYIKIIVILFCLVQKRLTFIFLLHLDKLRIR